ncbi:MAG: class I SAM-dependent methyltransferase [Xanthomonadales bacterium]|nr:class I SAM-dependent methyltransferase [Xanthomonadales bacterium]
MTSTPTDSVIQILARARAEELERLRTQHAFDASAYNSFMLAKALWRNGCYEEALAQFADTSERAPLAPDGHLALIRAAIMLGRLDQAESWLDRAEAACPPLPELAIHRAQLLAAARPAAARDALAPHRDDALAALYYEALDGLVDGRAPDARANLPAQYAAMWSGLHWLAGQPGAAIVGCPSQVLERAVEAARLDGLVLECGVYFGRSLTLLAGLAGQEVHGFDSFQGAPVDGSAGEAMDSTAGVLPEVPANARLHAGWFDDTLPAFLAANPGPVRVLHVDCALHTSTASVLRHAGERLVPGSVLLFGNFVGHPGRDADEFRAWQEFADSRGLRWRVLAGTLLGREVALAIEDSAA